VLASSLNKGFRGSFAAVLVTYLFIVLFSIFCGTESDSYSYPNIFYNYLSGKINTDWVILICNHLLLLLGAGLITYIVSNEEVTDKQNFFPLYLFLLINAMAVVKYGLSLFMLSNVVLLYAILQIFRIYRTEHALHRIFSACFWISVTIYFNVVNLFLIPFLFTTLLILRPFYWREFANALLGFVTPVFIYECMAYLFNSNRWYLFENTAELFSHFRMPDFSFTYLPFLGIILGLFTLSVFYYLSNGLGNSVKKQKTKSSFFWFLIFITPAIFTEGMNDNNILILLSIPLSFLTGEFLFLLRSKRITNVILVLLTAAALYFLSINSVLF
jgi:hypothetical protein